MRRWAKAAAGMMFGVTLAFSPAALAQDEESSDEGEAASGSLQRSNRMEFDARLIRGETAGSGAVFIFQRAPRKLPSMVPRRTSYLRDSVDETLGDRGSESFDDSKAKAIKDAARVEERKKKRNSRSSKKSKRSKSRRSRKK